jgi:hypothetical protein
MAQTQCRSSRRNECWQLQSEPQCTFCTAAELKLTILNRRARLEVKQPLLQAAQRKQLCVIGQPPSCCVAVWLEGWWLDAASGCLRVAALECGTTAADIGGGNVCIADVILHNAMAGCVQVVHGCVSAGNSMLASADCCAAPPGAVCCQVNNPPATARCTTQHHVASCVTVTVSDVGMSCSS